MIKLHNFYSEIFILPFNLAFTLARKLGSNQINPKAIFSYKHAYLVQKHINIKVSMVGYTYLNFIEVLNI